MATVDGLTKERMLAIEAESITAARIDPVTSHLILTTHGGNDIDVGDIHGPQGPQGIQGIPGVDPPASATVAGPAAFGDASTPGVDPDYSRGDHDHGLPALPPIPGGHSLIMGWITTYTGAAIVLNPMYRFAQGGQLPQGVVMPRAGVITGLVVAESLNATAGMPMRHYKVYKNGVATAVLIDTNVVGAAPNLVFAHINNANVAVAAGDVLSVQWAIDATTAGFPLNIEVGIEVVF